MANEETPKDEIELDDATGSGSDEQGVTPEPELLEDETHAPEHELAASELNAKLESLQHELHTQKELVLRARADVQNVQRRAERDVEHAHKFGLEKITQELLPVVDALERAMDAASGDDAAIKPILDGVELTLGMFVKALAKFNIEQVDPAGEPFNPQHHQAMSIVENDEVEANTVMAVMQKGYLLHGRLVRPAMVVVSKLSANASPKIDEQA